jgi:hypothetical protein
MEIKCRKSLMLTVGRLDSFCEGYKWHPILVEDHDEPQTARPQKAESVDLVSRTKVSQTILEFGSL